MTHDHIFLTWNQLELVKFADTFFFRPFWNHLIWHPPHFLQRKKQWVFQLANHQNKITHQTRPRFFPLLHPYQNHEKKTARCLFFVAWKISPRVFWESEYRFQKILSYQTVGYFAAAWKLNGTTQILDSRERWSKQLLCCERCVWYEILRSGKWDENFQWFLNKLK